jgi:hypothetical protein
MTIKIMFLSLKYSYYVRSRSLVDERRTETFFSFTMEAQFCCPALEQDSFDLRKKYLSYQSTLSIAWEAN